MSFNEWKPTKLGDEIELIYGKSLPKTKRIEGDYPVYGSGGITGTHNQFLVRGPGIIVGRKGTVGSVYYEQKDYFPIDTTYYIIPSDKYDLKFMYYFLKTQSLEKMNSHSAVPGLNREEVYKKSVMLPDINEQKLIADILSSLDDKIELNNQMNETLEEMAQALFKRWFVDFEFPNEEGQPYKSSGGEMVESELGMIPSTWKVGNLSDISIKIFSGGTPKTTEDSYWNGNYCWLSSGETRNRFILSTEKSITELGVKKSSTKLANKYNTVIASAGQGNTRGQASLLLLDTYINQSLISINPKMEFTFFSFLNIARRYEELRAISDSNSIRGSLTTKMIQKLSIVIPELTTLSKFNEIINPIIHQIEKNIEESIYLKDIRDILLPKLMSGEIRVSDLKS